MRRGKVQYVNEPENSEELGAFTHQGLQGCGVEDEEIVFTRETGDTEESKDDLLESSSLVTTTTTTNANTKWFLYLVH